MIGSLDLLGRAPHAIDDEGMVEAQALADVATIGILQQQAASEQRLLTQQLQYALQSRILVEQAKGILAEYGTVEMDEAFSALRSYSRDHNQRLVDVAEALVERRLTAPAMFGGQQPT